MWHDKSDRSICNQIAINIYSNNIINEHNLIFLNLSSCLTSAEDLLIYSRSVCGKDDETTAGLMASKKRAVVATKS